MVTLAPGDVNLANPGQLADVGIPPYDYFATLRRDAPVHWNPAPDDLRGFPQLVHQGFWVLTRYADVKAVSRDPARFSARKGTVLLFDVDRMPGADGRPRGEQALMFQRAGLMGMDPPDHTTFRRLVQAVFTPRSVAGLEPMIAEHARQVVDELEARGGSEFVMDTASQLPLIVLCELMGVPHEERDRYFGWANAVANLEDPEVDDVGALAALVGYCHQMVDQKRQRPDGSMLSTYANATIEGRQLTANEIAAFFATLSIAGHETTRNTTAHFVRLMDAHPDQKAFLLEDLPGRLPNAVEEVLRCSPPVMDFRRTATCDVELHGVTIREGDKVYLSYVSANRDDEVFDDPDRFDILRPNAGDHLSFGTGPHLCLGAGLARMQLRVLLGELYRRLPDITVAAAPEWVPSVWFNALARMPVTTTAG